LVAPAVAVAVAKLSPSINDDGFKEREKTVHEMLACPVVTSPQPDRKQGDSALVYVFPSASSIRVFTPRSHCGRGGSVRLSSGEQRRGLLRFRSAPRGIAINRRSGAARSEDP